MIQRADLRQFLVIIADKSRNSEDINDTSNKEMKGYLAIVL